MFRTTNLVRTADPTGGPKRLSLRKWLFMELWPGNPGGSGNPLAKCPKKQPRAYWNSLQSLRWRCYLAFGSAYLLVALYLCGMLPGIPRWALPIFLLFAMSSGALWSLATRRRLRGFVRKLREQDMHLCMNCGYSLHGLPARHVCPECGTDYDVDALRQAWEHWIKKRRLPDESLEPPSSSES